MFEFDVKDMSCGHCASTITKALKELDPQAKVEVDLDTRKVRVESSEDRASLVETLTEAGYPPS